MDRPVSAVATGFYDDERVDRETFAWTGQDVTLALPGVNRDTIWTCVVRLRGGRADPATLPEVALAVDGVVASRFQTSNDFADVRLDLPTAPQPGATITVACPTPSCPPGIPGRWV